MAQLTLYINTSNNTLVSGQQNTQPIGSSLPLFFGDTLSLKIYLLQTPEGYNATDPSNSGLETVPTAGLQLVLYLTDGKDDGTIYTQCVNFVEDATGSFFTGQLALNTAALQTLFGNNKTASCYLQVGYIQDGLNTTVLNMPVTLQVGIPTTPLTVPPGLTPLSVEAADAMFVPVNPLPGQPIYVQSADGLATFALRVVKNADGTYRFAADQLQ
jgi:hypothetical protein